MNQLEFYIEPKPIADPPKQTEAGVYTPGAQCIYNIKQA